MTAADEVQSNLSSDNPVKLIADNGASFVSKPLTLRQAIQRTVFELTFWIPEYIAGSKAANANDTVLGHAARAAGFGRAIWAQQKIDSAALVRIEAKLDTLLGKK